VIHPEENYGWKFMEGNSCFGNSLAKLFKSKCNHESLTLPIIDYSHKRGNCSVTGGHLYRGSKFPRLNGIYFYGDYCSGTIWGAVKTEGSQWKTKKLLDTELSISTFGEDEAGNLYVANHSSRNGAIYRIIVKP